MNIFGIILSLFILSTGLYIIFLIFFNNNINGYVRIALSGIGIIGIIYYIMFIMQKFWE